MRIATIALIHTGLSRESAQFQSRSALTGTGFTTSESDQVIGHPVRRRIIMLLGNAGLVSVGSSLALTFVGQHSGASTALKVVDRRLSRVIDWALHRYTRLDARDYASLMHLAGDYRIVELNVEEAD